MSGSTSTTATKIWKKMATKDYRDAYVSAHISNTVASQIAMLREKEGWTQKQLAQKSGMSQSRISALEDPNYENYEISTLKRVASAFDVGLTVRFTPFSELVSWVTVLSSEKLLVANFSEDHAPAQTVSMTTIDLGPPIDWNLYAGQVQLPKLIIDENIVIDENAFPIMPTLWQAFVPVETMMAKGPPHV